MMKAYLEAVRDAVGRFGEAYRGVGDEVVVLGRGHAAAIAIAETIRANVAALRCEYKGQALPLVTVSLGVATTPPEARSRDLDQIADQRQQLAKDRGKNRVVAE